MLRETEMSDRKQEIKQKSKNKQTNNNNNNTTTKKPNNDVKLNPYGKDKQRQLATGSHETLWKMTMW